MTTPRPIRRTVRRLLAVLLPLLVVGPGTAEARVHEVASRNFLVRARSRDVAQQVAEYAERYRVSKAQIWLGRAIPDWPRRCTVEVKLTFGGAGGATSFTFDDGRILSQEMVLEGSLDRIIDSVLPHEVTHTIFAAKFRKPLPRWADEGGAVLSEDYEEIARHDIEVRKVINDGRRIPLARLLELTEYPDDVMALYAQGFSVARYLVNARGHREFLDFVHDGQAYGWDRAVQSHYGFTSVGQLEHAWVDWLIAGVGTGADAPPPDMQPRLIAAAAPAPAATAAYPAPVVRGQMPDDRAVRVAAATDVPAVGPTGVMQVRVADVPSPSIPRAMPRPPAAAPPTARPSGKTVWTPAVVGRTRRRAASPGGS